MMSLVKHSILIYLFLLFKIYAGTAQAQTLNDIEKIERENNVLWADTIEYDRKQKKISAEGKVRLYIKNKNGIDMLFSDAITYNEKNGAIRAQGGPFSVQQEQNKNNNKKQVGKGLLQLQSNYLIFFQNIETNRNIDYLTGKNISLRSLNINGGFTARNFEIKKRKNKKEDWILYKVRYTKCPICADKKAKIEIKNQKINKNKKQKTKKKSSFAPIWRIDASKVHFENFKNKKYLKPSARVHMHNARVSIYGAPIFYTPYFSYPRYGQRASGFLAPTYSLGGVNGYSIAIPMFWAPHKSFDATYIPKFTTTGKDTSRIELRTAFAFGGEKKTKTKKNSDGEISENQSQPVESARKKTKYSKDSNNLISLNTGVSIPHAEIGSGAQAKFLAYAKGSWLAPKGLRANAKYHFIGDRDYLYDYGQGVDIFSTYAPTRLNDFAQIEHFSRNGYANIALQQQRELYDKPRADASLLPEILYENAGTFAVDKRGNAKWAVNVLWRGAVREKQNSIPETGIAQSEKLRQDLLNTSVTMGWKRYLGAGLTSNADAKIAINYWQQKLGKVKNSQWQILPEAQIGIEGLFANAYKNGATIFYLKPMLELYSTLKNIEKKSQQELNGEVEFYDQQKRIGQQMPFNTALDGGGQRLLSGLELGVKGARGSRFSMLIAPSVKWQEDKKEKQAHRIKTSGNLNLETKGSWRSYLSFAYDAKWLIPEWWLVSQKALIAAKYGIGDISLSYKELHREAQEKRIPYDKSLTLTGGISAFKKWRTSISMGYNLLREDKPFNNIAFLLNYDGSCIDFKLKYYRYFYSDREDEDSISFSFGLDF